jgi:hypothetical protein
MSSGISFFAQNQNRWASAAAMDEQLSEMNARAAKIFSGPPASTTSPTNVLAAATSTSNSIVNPFGLIALNFSLNSAVLAAQEGNDRVNTKTAQLNTATKAPGGDLSDQVTFNGTLAVDFGSSGPIFGGAYHFKTGTDLQTAFTTALKGQTSQGEAIDTVSVSGNTLTASTSGPNAHDVFNLSLDPQTGMYTFQLVGPLDMSTNKGTSKSLFLQGLIQATSANGQQASLPEIEMQIYNNYGSVTSQGDWALLHEGSVTYGTSNGIATSSSSSTSSSTSSTSSTSSSTKTPYKAPINPLTGYSYVTSTSAGLGVINSLNIFS